MSCDDSRCIVNHADNGFRGASYFISDCINDASDRSLGALLVWWHEKVVDEMRRGEELKRISVKTWSLLFESL